MNEKTQIMLIRVVLAIIVLLIIGAAIIGLAKIDWSSFGKKPIENNTIRIIEPPAANKTCNDSCKYELGKANMSYCGQIENATTKESCYEAWANENWDACIKMPAAKRDSCITANAKRLNNETLCNSAQNKTACQIAVNSCYAYSGKERNLCLAKSKKLVGYCELDDDCIIQYSVYAKDENACSWISMNAKKMACISLVEKKDRCGELKVPAEQDYCWEIYAKTTDDRNVCYDITSTSSYALECFSYFAIKTKDVDFCTKGGFLFNDLWNCYTDYSLGTKDLAGCNKIHKLATTAIYECYSSYAKKFGNPRACDLINDTGQTATCYECAILFKCNSTDIGVGNPNLNYTYCKDVAVEKWRNRCYTECAKLGNNSAICDYIPTVNEKGACLDVWRVYNNVTTK